MVKFFCTILAAAALTSCGNNSESADAGADTSVTQFRGVENVNGNIPDTAATGAEPSTNYHRDSVR